MFASTAGTVRGGPTVPRPEPMALETCRNRAREEPLLPAEPVAGTAAKGARLHTDTQGLFVRVARRPGCALGLQLSMFGAPGPTSEPGPHEI